MSDEGSKLGGILDGATLTEPQARALWKEFSEHMDANRGDMRGYATKKGWFSVVPEYRDGKAVLVVRTTAAAKGAPPIAAPPKPQQKARPQGGKPQQKAKPKPPPKQGAKPAPKPQAGQKAPPKPNAPAKPAAQGGQAPPKKRPT
jgi:hypothetical protein